MTERTDGIRTTVKEIYRLRNSIDDGGVCRADVYWENIARPSTPVAWARDRSGGMYYLCLWTDVAEVNKVQVN